MNGHSLEGRRRDGRDVDLLFNIYIYIDVCTYIYKTIRTLVDLCDCLSALHVALRPMFRTQRQFVLIDIQICPIQQPFSKDRRMQG